LPHLIASTDPVGVLPERAACLAPSGSGTTVVDLPFGRGPLLESLLPRARQRLTTATSATEGAPEIMT